VHQGQRGDYQGDLQPGGQRRAHQNRSGFNRATTR
jgi:hypothetical protein